MSWLSALRKRIADNWDSRPNDPWTYEVDDLVIVQEDEILYSGAADVAIQPDKSNPQRGRAHAILPDGGEPVAMSYEAKLEDAINPDPDVRRLGGITLFGCHSGGQAASWFIGNAGRRFLLDRARGVDPVPSLAEDPKFDIE